MNPKMIIIIALALLAVILTLVRESASPDSQSISVFSQKSAIAAERLHEIAVHIMEDQGIAAADIRPVKNRNDVRVAYPPQFEILVFLRSLNDSLSSYAVNVISFENPKERNVVVHVKSEESIIKSYIFSLSTRSVTAKGVSSSQKKQNKRP